MSAGQLQRSAPASPGGAPSTSKQAVPQIPFVIGSRNSSRFSFTMVTTALTAASQPLPPVQIPAMGYLKRIELEVTNVAAGGTTPTLTADAPFNVLAGVELRNSSGNDLIVPLTGYQMYLLEKYGCQDFDAPMGDMRADPTYTAVAVGGSFHFILSIPCEISPADGFGAIPALASNRSYQLQLTLAALGTVISSNPTMTVSIVGTAVYWTEPVAASASGVAQATAPLYNGSLNLWQLEPQPVTPGDKYIKSNNVGNVLRTLIFVLRTAAGARTQADWPAVAELYLDNFPMFYLPLLQWQSWMARLYQLRNVTFDAANGLDTGVFVIPFFALAEGAAQCNGRRSQYLPTLDTALLQLRGTSFGASASTLEIITNSVQPVSPTTGSSSAALYGIS